MTPRHDPLPDELRLAATAVRRCAVPLLGVLLTACNPYVAAVSVVSESYGVATDERLVVGAGVGYGDRG